MYFIHNIELIYKEMVMREKFRSW